MIVQCAQCEKDVDTNTLYWPNHIKDGRSNKYKDIFTDKEVRLINNNKRIKKYLKTNGYSYN